MRDKSNQKIDLETEVHLSFELELVHTPEYCRHIFEQQYIVRPAFVLNCHHHLSTLERVDLENSYLFFQVADTFQQAVSLFYKAENKFYLFEQSRPSAVENILSAEYLLTEVGATFFEDFSFRWQFAKYFLS